MSTATERIPVLVSANEKSRIAKMAKDAGLSMGEFLRRAATAFRPDEENQILESMIVQMLKSTEQANQAIDDAIKYVEASNKRIAAMEQKQAI